MCCLFGVLNYNSYLSQKQMNKTISVLATACEARGTDATGIAYNGGYNLSIFKRPMPAHFLRFDIPDVPAIMGHTRLTTKGDEKFNYNNHPFYGRAANTSFALAHNGVLHNDHELRKNEHLPITNIETDSYVAVQLIEQKGQLDFESLKYMAEQLEGSFTITVLDRENNLYFVKGDNPLCLYHFEDKGVYIYASTEEILQNALKKLPYRLGKYKKISLACGEILKIDRFGQQTKSLFNTDKLFMYGYGYRYTHWFEPEKSKQETVEKEYLDVLKSIAASMGYTRECIDDLIRDGFTVDDIEEILYCG